MGKPVKDYWATIDCFPPFLTNPLFLDFCLWFLYTNECFVPLHKRSIAQAVMVAFCGEIIGSHALIFEDILRKYPAVDIAAAHEVNDTIRLKFFGEVLANCHDTRYLLFRSSDYLDWTLMAMQPVLKSLWCVNVKDSFQISCAHKSTIVLNVLAENPSLLDTILKHVQHMGENPSLHLLTCSTTVDMSKLLIPNVEVHVGRGVCLKVLGGRIPYSPSLTRLLFTESNCSDIVSVLSAAMRDGNLPALSHLSFVRCKGLQGKLSVLFERPWPMLIHLNLCGTSLGAQDLSILSRYNFMSIIVPKLSHFVLPLTDVSGGNWTIPALMKNILGNLTIFYADCPSKTAVLEIISVIKQGNITNLKGLGILSPQDKNCTNLSVLPLEFLPSLETVVLHRCIGPVSKVIAAKLASFSIRKLDFAHNHGISGTLSILLCHKCPHLEFLILSDCALNAEDLRSLAETNSGDRLPHMKHLDVTQNSAPFNLLCYNFSVWRQLICLNVADAATGPKLTIKVLDPASFPSVRALSVSNVNYFSEETKWQRLETIHLVNPYPQQTILSAYRKFNFPALRIIYVKSVNFEAGADLAEKNMSCHLCNLTEYPFNEHECVCQQVIPVEQSQSN